MVFGKSESFLTEVNRVVLFDQELSSLDNRNLTCKSIYVEWSLFLEAQFDRCLDQHYGIVLSTPEETVLMQKYGSHPDHLGMVNYRSFCQNIDQGKIWLVCKIFL